MKFSLMIKRAVEQAELALTQMTSEVPSGGAEIFSTVPTWVLRDFLNLASHVKETGENEEALANLYREAHDERHKANATIFEMSKELTDLGEELRWVKEELKQVASRELEAVRIIAELKRTERINKRGY